MSSADRALLFPGQGAQAPEMLAPFAAAPRFSERAAAVAEALGEDTLARLEAGDAAFLERNAVSSLLTVLASRLALDLAGPSLATPVGLAGYSVGQWTALHAAGGLGFTELVRVVHRRAELMDASVARQPGGMIGVIGLGQAEVEEVCAAVREQGLGLWIANDNCVGQLSLAGEPAALDAALEELGTRAPKRLLRLPVAGPWHCELMRGAAEPFRTFLDEIDLRAPRSPVVDNVTGEFLPEDPAALRDQLALHLYRPVRWQTGIRSLIAAGARELVEVGYGDLLTRFGFFIDRTVRHRALAAGREPASGRGRTTG